MRNAMGDTEIKQLSETADPSQGQWSQMEMLLAKIDDSVRNLTYATIKMQGGKPGKPPEPNPRPGVKAKGKRARKQLSPQEAEFMYRLINGPDAE